MSTGTLNRDAFEYRGIKRAIILSAAAHVGLFLFLIIKSVVAPTEPKVYVPSMRVDLVALPTHKINENVQLKPAAPAKEVEKEKPEPKEIKVKESAEKADVTISSKKKKSSEKLKTALAKIRALEKINSEQIAGNQISKGSAITGDAKTSLETTYFDVVLEKIRANWELPKWLQDANVSAKVAIQIDRSGNVTSLQFLKSSGNDQFDQEVKRAIQASAPFPAPPTAILAEVATDGITLGFPL